MFFFFNVYLMNFIIFLYYFYFFNHKLVLSQSSLFSFLHYYIFTFNDIFTIIYYLKMEGMSEARIDAELRKIEGTYSKQEIQFLRKKNELLEKERDSLKTLITGIKKQLSMYKEIALGRTEGREILELQHDKIVELEKQLEEMKIKYEKSLNMNHSFKETQYASKYRDLEKKYREQKLSSEREIADLKSRLAGYTGKQFIDSNKKVLQPLQDSKGLMFKYRKIN